MMEVALFGAGRIGKIHAANVVRQAGVKLRYVIDVDAAAGSSTIVLNLKLNRGDDDGEAGRLAVRRVNNVAYVQITYWNELMGGDCDTVVGQRAKSIEGQPDP